MPLSDEGKTRTFNELVDWAAGHLLTELIAGRFRSGVHTVAQTFIMWRDEEVEKKKGTQKKR